jgi:hypothetical protein
MLSLRFSSFCLKALNTRRSKTTKGVPMKIFCPDDGFFQLSGQASGVKKASSESIAAGFPKNIKSPVEVWQFPMTAKTWQKLLYILSGKNQGNGHAQLVIALMNELGQWGNFRTRGVFNS